MAKKVKFKEMRPFLGKEIGQDYFAAFRIAKGSPTDDAIRKDWNVIIGVGLNNWAGKVEFAPIEKDWGGKKGKNIVARVQYQAMADLSYEGDCPVLNAEPIVGDDPETVTVVVGPTMGVLTQVVDESDVVYDVP